MPRRKKQIADIVPQDVKKTGRSNPKIDEFFSKKRSTASKKIARKVADHEEEIERSSIYKYVAILAVGALLLGFGALSLTEGAKITVVPRVETQDVQVEFLAGDTNDSDIKFRVITETISRSESLNSTGVKEVDKRASGKIRVFNDSASSQRLIARTRFETENGTTFRITDPIRVPGKSGGTPGSLDVTVYADEPGKDYNVGFSDFTIPGLKGTPVYNDFYARSLTEIKGGFSGAIYEVDDDELETLIETTEEDISIELITQPESLEEGNFSFSDGLFLTFENELRNEVGDNVDRDAVPLNITGKLKRVVVDREVIVGMLIDSAFGDLPVEQVPNDIINLDDLSVEIFEKDLITDVTNQEEIAIKVTGSAKFVWKIHEEAIKERIKGLEKNESSFQNIFSREFPNIIEARVDSLSPFWSGRFPENSDDITIIEEIEG